MTGWKCQDCGLVHRHAKHMHQLWDIDGLDWEWIKNKMQFNPQCHCGVREAKMALEKGELFPYVTEEAADTIRGCNEPLPRGMERTIERRFD